MAVECRYRGRVIGKLVVGRDGFLEYRRLMTMQIVTVDGAEYWFKGYGERTNVWERMQ
jgi:hypothetical protein